MACIVPGMESINSYFERKLDPTHVLFSHSRTPALPCRSLGDNKHKLLTTLKSGEFG